MGLNGLIFFKENIKKKEFRWSTFTLLKRLHFENCKEEFQVQLSPPKFLFLE